VDAALDRAVHRADLAVVTGPAEQDAARRTHGRSLGAGRAARPGVLRRGGRLRLDRVDGRRGSSPGRPGCRCRASTCPATARRWPSTPSSGVAGTDGDARPRAGPEPSAETREPRPAAAPPRAPPAAPRPLAAPVDDGEPSGLAPLGWTLATAGALTLAKYVAWGLSLCAAAPPDLGWWALTAGLLGAVRRRVRGRSFNAGVRSTVWRPGTAVDGACSRWHVPAALGPRPRRAEHVGRRPTHVDPTEEHGAGHGEVLMARGSERGSERGTGRGASAERARTERGPGAERARSERGS
jgi:hypothetical protein